MMKEKVFAFLEEYGMIQTGDHVAVGVSGGADSVCLLLLLLEYCKKKRFKILVVHINHGIRKEAVEDAAFVEELCRQNGLSFFLFERDVPGFAKQHRLSVEEAGRKLRYEAFREVLRKYERAEGADPEKGRIAVAHHRQDSAETLLFHLFRGTGIRGLAGIRPVRGRVIRPLLSCGREEIEEYLVRQGVSWRIDSSNADDTYSRNRIRNRLIPYIEKELVPSASSHVARTALEIAGLMDYLEQEIEKAAAVCCQVLSKPEEGEIRIRLREWLGLPVFLQEQVLLWSLERLTAGRKDITHKHIKALKALPDKNGSKRVDLPGNLEGIKEYDFLILRNKRRTCEEQPPFFAQTLPVPGRVNLEDGRVLELSLVEREKVEGLEENPYTKYLDYDKINNCLSLRYREKGDYLVINQQGQKKRLKEYMIQEKIPAASRERIPLIADGNHIAWVIGYRISSHYKVGEHTQRCLQMKIWRA